ncbi:borealin-2-like isoform X1 [Arapaima gigas]
MPPKVRKNSQRSDGEQDSQLSKEQRDQKIKLFMQQFEKEAQERMGEMEAKLEQTLATLERVFRVELMKIPPATRNTRIKDLLGGKVASVSELWFNKQMHEFPPPASAILSHSGTSVPKLQRTLSATGKKSTRDASKKISTYVITLAATCSLIIASSRVAVTSTAKRTQTRVAKTGNETTASASQMRSIQSSGLRLPDTDGTNTSPLMATATVSTSQGETLFLTDDLKDHIDVKMLDDMAVLQMEQLRKLMDYLCNKVRQSQ